MLGDPARRPAVIFFEHIAASLRKNGLDPAAPVRLVAERGYRLFKYDWETQRRALMLKLIHPGFGMLGFRGLLQFACVRQVQVVPSHAQSGLTLAASSGQARDTTWRLASRAV